MVYPFFRTDFPLLKIKQKSLSGRLKQTFFSILTSASNHTITDYVYQLGCCCWSLNANLYRKFCNSICVNCCFTLTVCTIYKLNIKKVYLYNMKQQSDILASSVLPAISTYFRCFSTRVKHQKCFLTYSVCVTKSGRSDTQLQRFIWLRTY